MDKSTSSAAPAVMTRSDPGIGPGHRHAVKDPVADWSADYSHLQIRGQQDDSCQGAAPEKRIFVSFHWHTDCITGVGDLLLLPPGTVEQVRINEIL
jgi:hypothetical protein